MGNTYFLVENWGVKITNQRFDWFGIYRACANVRAVVRVEPVIAAGLIRTVL